MSYRSLYDRKPGPVMWNANSEAFSSEINKDFPCHNGGKWGGEMRELMYQRSSLSVPQPASVVDARTLAAVQDAISDAQRLAMHAEYVALRTQKDLLTFKHNQLRRAQSYLPGEATARMRGLLYEWSGIKCLRCGIVMTLDDGLPNSCEIDEVLPRARGGNRTWNNVQALCRQCNGERGEAAQRGVIVEWSWDFRQKHPVFVAACAREQCAYERRAAQQQVGFSWGVP